MQPWDSDEDEKRGPVSMPRLRLEMCFVEVVDERLELLDRFGRFFCSLATIGWLGLGLGVGAWHTDLVELIVHDPVDAEVVELGGLFCRLVVGRETH